MATKLQEMQSGCLAKAGDDEPLFVLRAQDILAPATIRNWCEFAFLAGTPAEKLKEARELALAMEEWAKQNKSKAPD